MTEWSLIDGEAMAEQYPANFGMRPREERYNLPLGSHAYIGFLCEGGGERMWVRVVAISGEGRYTGRLINDAVTPGIPTRDDLVNFQARHVLDRELQSA